MALSPIDNGSSGRGRFRGGGAALSEINVTPFVDVLLVLLIIFMLTAHVMESGIEVDVPEVKTTTQQVKDLPVVNISKEGEFYLGEKPININDLVPTIVARYGKSQTVYVRADKLTPWETVAQAVAELGAGKISVSMVTKPEEVTRKRR